ncbi:MAG: thioredoxin domain-containing protein [Nonlabens ulvanivorans]|uniref:Thioredoxin n=2 Tax=Nonlabens ulvanivorans TaxID=906888 RepID=A0A081DF12_NONUL|nr:thioredoxin domain-containing protein [Nonlabens ulvanivorans]KEZ93308.1 thioredoxin [Nonlabens ulvanivorans]PRX13567.1 thioredoxin 1 [Nonlabens ulvanivorans]GAK77508.1 thioredoxin [Nonlabens ulvanivorans]
MKNLLLLMLGMLSLQAIAQIEINDDNAEEKLLINNDKLIIVDFYATWCGPCKRMDPIIERLAEKYGDRISIYKIDVDENEVDDALSVTSIPTYYFIKNKETLDYMEGAMSEEDFEDLIIEHGGFSSSSSNAGNSEGTEGEYSQDSIDAIWYDSNALNSKAWHAYLEHSEIDVLLKSIKMVKRSIELDANYNNTDTYAALLYKTGRYDEAWKQAKAAILLAKEEDVSYSSTQELLLKIVDKM